MKDKCTTTDAGREQVEALEWLGHKHAEDPPPPIEDLAFELLEWLHGRLVVGGDIPDWRSVRDMLRELEQAFEPDAKIGFTRPQPGIPMAAVQKGVDERVAARQANLARTLLARCPETAERCAELLRALAPPSASRIERRCAFLDVVDEHHRSEEKRRRADDAESVLWAEVTSEAETKALAFLATWRPKWRTHVTPAEVYRQYVRNGRNQAILAELLDVSLRSAGTYLMQIETALTCHMERRVSLRRFRAAKRHPASRNIVTRYLDPIRPRAIVAGVSAETLFGRRGADVIGRRDAPFPDDDGESAANPAP